MAVLRIHRNDFESIKGFFQKEKCEQFVFLLAEKIIVNSLMVLYVVREVIFPDEDNMKIHHTTLVEPEKECQMEVYKIAVENGYTIFDWHNHWFQANPDFSSIDREAALENGRFISRHLPGVDFGLAVFNGEVNAYSGMVFNKTEQDFDPLESIEVMGSPVELMFNRQRRNQATINEKYQRHTLVPGWKQDQLHDLVVSVVGAGGNGAHVIQALSCLGVGEDRGGIIIVDPDSIEESNLPRIPYAGQCNVGMPKAEVAADYIKFKNPRIKVTAINKSIHDPEVQQEVKKSHLIMGCVDSEGARKTISKIAQDACIPFIDLGTEIIPEGDGCHSGGQARVILPREGCLICIGGINLSEAANELVSESTAEDLERVGYVRGTNQTPTPSVVHLNGVTSYLGISQLMKVVFGEDLDGQKAVFYDQQRMSILAAGFEQNPGCPLCGSHQQKEGNHELTAYPGDQHCEGINLLHGTACPDPGCILPGDEVGPGPARAADGDEWRPDEPDAA